jgi:hypothetical protein
MPRGSISFVIWMPPTTPVLSVIVLIEEPGGPAEVGSIAQARSVIGLDRRSSGELDPGCQNMIFHAIKWN